MRPFSSRYTRILILVSLFGGTLSAAGRAAAQAGSQKSYLPVVFTSGCQTFPADNIWNARIDQAPVDPHSAEYIRSMSPTKTMHADFGSGLWDGAPIGIPFIVVDGSAPWRAVQFDYSDESDPGPYPIPANTPIEGGSNSNGDRHVLIVDQANCHLYELYYAFPQSDSSWYAGSGAIFDLRSNDLRPEIWTSADAAGLPIYPGLVRYEEFAAGEIRHAIRVTAAVTQKAYVWPARHYASSNTSQSVPPMGQRFRLKASFDISKFTTQQQIFLKAFKMYGLILADNGSSWYISGAPDDRWDNDWLHTLFSSLHGSDFEAVDVSGMMADPNSALVKNPSN